MGFLVPEDINGVRVAYLTQEQTSSPLPRYDERYSTYSLKISWNKFQSARKILRKMPILGKLETKFPDYQLTVHTLSEGVAGYNDNWKHIVIQANDKRKANKCARELNLPTSNLTK
jgi:hypothetical protein